MVYDAYVDHVPVLTGGSGKDGAARPTRRISSPKMPPDMEMTPISRTVGDDQLVDEMAISLRTALI